jgi:hypothetical protein
MKYVVVTSDKDRTKVVIRMAVLAMLKRVQEKTSTDFGKLGAGLVKRITKMVQDAADTSERNKPRSEEEEEFFNIKPEKRVGFKR